MKFRKVVGVLQEAMRQWGKKMFWSRGLRIDNSVGGNFIF